MEDSLGFIDLFSGAGGFSLGFIEAGFQPLFFAENWKPAIDTHHANFEAGHLYEANVQDLTGAEIRRISKTSLIHCLIGGPPCQGFSTIGKRLVKDGRNELVFHFARLVRELRPDSFVMENVRGLFSSHGGAFKDGLLELFANAEYKVKATVLCAADYGVPQMRYRTFFIGLRDDLEVAPTFPLPTHSKMNYQTVGPAIMDLVGLENTVPNHVPMNHNPIVRERINHICEGQGINQETMPTELLSGSRSDYRNNRLKNFSHVYRRLARNRPATTMVPGHNAFPLHPTQPRSLTVREAARLQTFPDSFIFHGTRQDQCIQVGNAVPVALATQLGLHLKKLLTQTQ